jgi:hypothetical protein
MPNKNESREPFDETTLKMPENHHERRKSNRNNDRLYQLVMGLNIIAWFLLIGALILLHYARPEFITGVQSYWGIEGREIWSEDHLGGLLTLLQICLFTTIVTIILRSRRNRRKTDRFGVNVMILLIISVTSLATLYMVI